MKRLLKLNKKGLCSLSCLNSCAFGLLFYSFGFFAKHSKLKMFYLPYVSQSASVACVLNLSAVLHFCFQILIHVPFAPYLHLILVIQRASFKSMSALFSPSPAYGLHTVLPSTISALPCSFIGVKSPNSFLLRFNKLKSVFF